MSLNKLIVKAQPTAVEGKVEAVGTIGAGTFSSVMLLTDNRIAKRFNDSTPLDKIRREVITLAGFRAFPHLMHINEFYRHNDKYYIISEYYGKTLRINEKHQNKAVEQIGYQLFYALALLEALQISHRDLKPENMCISSEAQLTLIDFGLSLPLSSLRQRVGTLQYQAPENFLYGETHENSDVFGAGVVLLNMVNGQKMLYSHSREEHFTVLEQFVRGFAGYCADYQFKALEKQKLEQGQYSGAVVKDQLLQDLLARILIASPDHRISAVEALNHEYFLAFEADIAKLPYTALENNVIIINKEACTRDFRLSVADFLLKK